MQLRAIAVNLMAERSTSSTGHPRPPEGQFQPCNFLGHGVAAVLIFFIAGLLCLLRFVLVHIACPWRFLIGRALSSFTVSLHI